jgi:uracil-DNA glycosylase
MVPGGFMAGDLERLLSEIRACRICEKHLPLGPRPVLRAAVSARLVIIGQAPGTRVHESGVPWDDASGERLRSWLDLDPEHFYDESRVAIVPMGFCYPGVAKNGGDKPPRPECAAAWHGLLLEHLENVDLTLLVGSYAQKYYLGSDMRRTMTETVADWRTYLPSLLPLPHPSWRNTAWLKRNLWFDSELVPELRRRVRKLSS